MRNLHAIALAFLIAGCATQAPPPVATQADRPAAAPVDMGVDWGWRVLGDAAVRPVQVFSTGGQTYVQMRDRRPVVLIVNGEVVPHLTSWPYLVIQGVPGQLDVVADGFRALAEHPATAYEARQIDQSAQGDENNRVERVKLK